MKRTYELDALYSLTDIMDTEYACPFSQGYGIENGSTIERILRSDTQRLIYHRLTRHAHQQRQFHHQQPLQFAQQSEILLHGLAKAEAGVKDDVLLPEITQLLHFIGKD